MGIMQLCMLLMLMLPLYTRLLCQGIWLEAGRSCLEVKINLVYTSVYSGDIALFLCFNQLTRVSGLSLSITVSTLGKCDLF